MNVAWLFSGGEGVLAQGFSDLPVRQKHLEGMWSPHTQGDSSSRTGRLSPLVQGEPENVHF